jgi:nucleoid-associated protein YgaU
VPATIPKEGVAYKIRWGDTLWDISAAFYRNPWQYQRIARFNNIRNPNMIISGRTIRIPPLR